MCDEKRANRIERLLRNECYRKRPKTMKIIMKHVYHCSRCFKIYLDIYYERLNKFRERNNYNPWEAYDKLINQ